MKEIQDMLTLFAQQVKSVLGNDLKQILVYGSYARGDYNENSDVDIMILTSLPHEKIRAAEEKICDIAFDFLIKEGSNSPMLASYKLIPNEVRLGGYTPLLRSRRQVPLGLECLHRGC